jgi:hypothetical protein
MNGVLLPCYGLSMGIDLIVSVHQSPYSNELVETVVKFTFVVGRCLVRVSARLPTIVRFVFYCLCLGECRNSTLK